MVTIHSDLWLMGTI